MASRKPTPYGRAIREIRQQARKTLDEVASTIGTDATNLSRIERGLQAPSMKTFEAIAEALGVTPAQIYQQAVHRDSDGRIARVQRRAAGAHGQAVAVETPGAAPLCALARRAAGRRSPRLN